MLEQKEKDELKTTFKEVVEEGLKPVNEKIEGVAKSQSELDARLKKIEELPVKAQRVNASEVGRKVYGFKVSRFGTERLPGLGGKSLRQHIADNPHSFEAFNDDEKFEDFGEFLLDFVQASKYQNPEARRKLYERQQKANYAEGGATTGDTLVPVEYQWDMIQLARNRAFALNECSVIPMSGDTLTLPREASMVTVAWKDEATPAADGEGTFDSVTLNAKKLTALATASNELLGDAAVDLVGILTEQFSYAVNLELDNQVLSGTGAPVSGLMKGTAGYSVVLGTGSGNFSMVIADNFSNAISQLEDGDLAGAKWVFGKTMKHYLRILKETTGGYIFAQPGAGVPGTVWEYPYIESSKCPANATSTVAALFGNLRYFYIGRRLGSMVLDMDPYGKFAEYQTRFRIVTRWGLALARASAFATIKTSA